MKSMLGKLWWRRGGGRTVDCSKRIRYKVLVRLTTTRMGFAIRTRRPELCYVFVMVTKWGTDEGGGGGGISVLGQ